MMYHRIAIIKCRAPLARLAEQETCAVAQELVDDKEKDCCYKHENKSHDGCNNRFTTGWPNNLCNFCPHLLEKCEWVCF